MMNLQHLRVFHAVAEAGGVTAGAARLRLSQPAATREIRDLEARLGLALFDRLPRGVALTEAGRLLQRHAARIFAQESAAEAELLEFAGLGRGRLAMGASNTIGTYVLPPLIGRFHGDYPGIEVILRVFNSEEVVAGLRMEEVSLGFVEGPVEADGFARRAIGGDEIVAVAHPGHPFADGRRLRAVDLAEGVVFAREPGSGTRATVEQAHAALGLAFRPVLSVGSGEALKTLLLSAPGIAWMSRLSVLSELDSGRLSVLPVEDLAVRRSFTMLWPPDRVLSPATMAFFDRMVATVPDVGTASSRS